MVELLSSRTSETQECDDIPISSEPVDHPCEPEMIPEYPGEAQESATSMYQLPEECSSPGGVDLFYDLFEGLYTHMCDPDLPTEDANLEGIPETMLDAAFHYTECTI